MPSDKTNGILPFWKDGELYLKTDKEIREKINGLEASARQLLMRTKAFRMEDMFFWAVIDKSIKLINPFLYVYKTMNLEVMATLLRVQMDCVMKSFAMTLVDDSEEYCKRVLMGREEVHKILDRNKQKLTDRYICEKLSEYLGVPVYQLYKRTCEFVHFSSSSFTLMTKLEGENDISFFVGRGNRPDQRKEIKRLSKELANQFYFFSSVLQNDLLSSWYSQLEYEESLDIKNDEQSKQSEK